MLIDGGREAVQHFNQSTPTFLFSFLSTPRKEKKCGIDDWLMAGLQPALALSTSIFSLFLMARSGPTKERLIELTYRAVADGLVPRSLTPFHCRMNFTSATSCVRFIHCFHSISSTHLLSLAAHPSISFISFNQFTF